MYSSPSFRNTISNNRRNNSYKIIANPLKYSYQYVSHIQRPNLDFEDNYRYNNADIKNIIDTVENIKNIQSEILSVLEDFKPKNDVKNNVFMNNINQIKKENAAIKKELMLLKKKDEERQKEIDKLKEQMGFKENEDLKKLYEESKEKNKELEQELKNKENEIKKLKEELKANNSINENIYSRLKTDITESFNDRYNKLEKKFEDINNSISSLNTNINNSNNNNINSNNNQVIESVNAQIIPSDHIVGNEGIGYRYQNE
jgi:chromosome segregation ATPase